MAATRQQGSTESSFQSKQCPSPGTWLLGWNPPSDTQEEGEIRNLSVRYEQSKNTPHAIQTSGNMWVEGPGSLDYPEDGLDPDLGCSRL